MNIEEIKEKTKSACQLISDTDSGVWYTSEWNICSHIRSRLEEFFSEHNVDVELVKEDLRRPDIAIHRRGDNSDNLIAFQAKKNPTTQDLKDDLNKITETFFKNPYLYKFGVLISIGKLPEILPEFDITRIGIVQVYGWVLDVGEKKDDTHL